MTPDPLDLLVARLRRAADRQGWCTGFQVHAFRDDDVLISESYGHDGLGSPVESNSIFAIYCAGKPITALAIGQLVERGELSFDDRLGDAIAAQLDPTLVSLSVEDVITHRAGLWKYPAESFMMLDARTRAEAVCRLRGERSSDGIATYAEFAGWKLLRLVIEGITGQTFVDYVSNEILVPFGLADDIFFRLPAEHARRGDLRINVDLEPGVPVPLLWEASNDNLTDVSPSSGARASMRGLANLYKRLVEIATGQRSSVISRASLGELTAPCTVTGDDLVLGRVCQQGRGFMVDLRRHQFSTRFGPASFGHSGLNGMTFAGADPDIGFAFAVHLNAVTAHQRDSADPDLSPQIRRQIVTDHLLAVIQDGSLAASEIEIGGL